MRRKELNAPIADVKMQDASRPEALRTAESDAENFEEWTLILRIDALELDARGRLTEAPDLLEIFDEVRAGILRDLATRVEVGASKIAAGSYQADILFFDGPQLALLDRTHIAKEWLDGVATDVKRIASNAMLAQPQSAEILGLTDSRLALLKSLSRVGDAGRKLVLRRNDIDKEVPVPISSSTELRALPPKAKPPQRVNGKVTGVGVGRTGGVRIEISFGVMGVLSQLSLESALDFLQSEAYFSGTLHYVDAVATFKEFQFTVSNELFTPT